MLFLIVNFPGNGMVMCENEAINRRPNDLNTGVDTMFLMFTQSAVPNNTNSAEKQPVFGTKVWSTNN